MDTGRAHIRRLPPEVANRIAAGEVVERPASLVKELVENSIDAGATHVEVVFEGGGIDRIRVSDDGAGIPADEVALAFERHATSKVWDPADLDAIATLGFRGEALASIAAVSNVELLTMTASGDRGTQLRAEMGRIVHEGPGARAPGTTIEVTQLFANTPARRKFLRAPATEGRVLVRTLGHLALGCLGVGFTVIRDGRTVLRIVRDADFRARVAELYGADVVRRMIEIVNTREGVTARGIVAPSEFSRTRGSHQALLVNRRPILDHSIAHAVAAGIGGAVPGGRFPIFALALTVAPHDVDVNVHPTKREVRFRRKNVVYSVVREAVAMAVVDTHFDALGRTGVLPWKSGRPDPAAKVTTTVRSWRVVPPAPADDATGTREARAAEPVPEAKPTALRERRLRLVGEAWGAYLVVEDEDRLLLVDQHAAHERVLYDEIRTGFRAERSMAVQGLLVPLSVDLAAGQEPGDVVTILEEMGFDAVAGGPSSVLVSGVPGNLTRWGGGEFLRELFASAEGARASAEKLRDALAKSYSCRGAVKFGQRLHPEEIEYLLRRLERTDVPRLCPHGRPIFLEVSRASIDDRFERT